MRARSEHASGVIKAKIWIDMKTHTRELDVSNKRATTCVVRAHSIRILPLHRQLGLFFSRHGLLHARKVDVLAVAIRIRLVPLVTKLPTVFHRFAVTLELAFVGNFTFNHSEVDRHLDRVQRTGDEGQEQRRDTGDAHG